LALLAALALVQASPAQDAAVKPPAAATGAAATPAAATEPPADPMKTAVQGYLRQYADAFNKQDAAALAEMWAEDGIYIDRETGDRTEGRAQIKADFEAAFAERKDARMSIELVRAKQLGDGIVVFEGQTGLVVPESEPESSVFTAIAVKKGDKWLLSSVDESAIPVPTSGSEALDALDWLVGYWVEDDGETQVSSAVTWTGGGNYLLWAFVVSNGEEEIRRGTHVIGWDARAKKIRSWCFESDGSFSESTWAANGDRWLSDTIQTLPDGSAASGNFVLTRVDENNVTLQLVGQELDGVPVPSRPAVNMVRVEIVEEEALEETAETPATAAPADPAAGTGSP
jgi:uncharacterized protein (TIGR02246 family)